MVRDFSVDPLAWGVIGGGNISGQFAAALTRTRRGRLVAVAGRDGVDRAEERFPGARVHIGYERLLSDPDVEAVYIGLLHPSHAEWVIRAAEAGKHVLCEKPLGLNQFEAEAAIEAAREHGVLLMEGFMYRTHPQTRILIDLIRAGRIGDVRLITASFGFDKPFDAAGRHFDPLQAGGAILDVGCYCVSMARLVCGVASGEEVAEPLEVTATGLLGRTGVDEEAAALLGFAHGRTALLSTSVRLQQDNKVRVFGTEGSLEIASPWFCGARGEEAVIRVTSADGTSEALQTGHQEPLYGFEAEAFADAVTTGHVAWPAVTPADSLGNMRVLDRWRRAIGLTYPMEKPGGRPATVSGRPLEHRPAGSTLPDGEIAGLAKRMTRVVLGTAWLETYPHAQALYDAYFESGGCVFDTARRYRGGEADRLLGQWVQARGVREDVVIVGKGGHPPFDTPALVRKELLESLEDLRTDRIDIYLLHRDNESIPVEAWIDALEEDRLAGRITLYGASNWSPARYAAANAYARRSGKMGFSVLSNHFSLADMVEPVWPGTIAASDEATTSWLIEHGTVLLAWSSQARGFFTERAGRDRRDNAEFVRCWYSEDNFARRDRAAALAGRLGVPMSHIPLAYALAQSFPCFPLIGPVSLTELRDSLRAAQIRLTPATARWLRSGDGAPDV